ncbi:DUF2934 domain-containing protein [Indioceanicola profundi]|uniref:DUF2934 domain-containing protein n=1 Tax=Indioceanicola profundi TaxID=2220096 RepID=UPI000E6AD5A5|nr:DUF2934 domain-containing protein [Indioceanicola profundi]
MSDNNSLEDRIRQKAHDIWEREGRPEGREREHWDMASELIAQHDNAAMTRGPNPSHGPDDVATRDQPVEPAFIAENQGEVPGLTDQGEQGNLAPSHQNQREAAER